MTRAFLEISKTGSGNYFSRNITTWLGTTLNSYLEYLVTVRIKIFFSGLCYESFALQPWSHPHFFSTTLEGIPS